MKRHAIIAIATLLVVATLPAIIATYADLTFTADAAGVVTIDGTTNVPALTPGTYQNFTSKEGARWTLNITVPGTVQTFVYTVTLPPDAQVNYVTGKNARITTDGSRVVVKGSGEDAPFAVVIQYTIVPASENAYRWIPLAAVIVILFALGFAVRARKRRDRAEARRHGAAHAKYEDTHSREHPSTQAAPTYLDGIPERQRAIVELLRKAGGTLTQRQIELALKLPKSSISRNVEALRIRGIVEKGQQGMTNTVVLGEKYR